MTSPGRAAPLRQQARREGRRAPRKCRPPARPPSQPGNFQLDKSTPCFHSCISGSPPHLHGY